LDNQLYIGLMSGTSLDGIDAALVAFSKTGTELISKFFLPFDDTLKLTILDLHQPSHNELHKTQLTGNQLARQYAIAVDSLLKQVSYLPGQIQAIGCHGQTIRHCPEHGYTLQIGNAALLAELTGITVVNDFRSRDIAAGRQGAPLVPAFHDKILRHPDIHRVIVNIGGISNLTNLPPGNATSGFDCGPGNLLMDAWCMEHLGLPFDADGAWAATGNVLPKLLDRLLAEPFFALPPPKSSGRDLFNMAWLQSHLHGEELPEDVQATLACADLYNNRRGDHRAMSRCTRDIPVRWRRTQQRLAPHACREAARMQRDRLPMYWAWMAIIWKQSPSPGWHSKTG